MRRRWSTSSPTATPVRLARLAPLCAAAGLLLGACRGHVDEQSTTEKADVRKAAQKLLPAGEFYTGLGLGPKQLVLTIDDGPNIASVTGGLSTWLKTRATPIRATYFVNGACVGETNLPNDSCGEPTPGAAAILAQLVADGHLIANHSTTHRDITGVPAGERVQELAETDALIKAYIPWNRFLFRAPFGFWSAAVNTTVSASAMSKYVGPIYWSAGGGPTDENRAADWECWQLGHTTRQCGDLYLKEIRAVGKGLVLVHDRSAAMNVANHELDTGVGNTPDMVKYIVPILEGEGFTFRAIYEDPDIRAALPACDPACVECSGPAANECTSCAPGSFAKGGVCTPCSTCAAGAVPTAVCAGTVDTVCGGCDPSCTVCSGPDVKDCNKCLPGFWAGKTVCEACTVCPAGTFQSAACTGTANTVCSPCTGGTFSSAPGATQCSSCADCNDNNACTTDSCSASAGCTHTPIADCTSPLSVTSDGGTDTGDDNACSVGAVVGSRSPPSWSAAALAACALGLARKRRRHARARAVRPRG